MSMQLAATFTLDEVPELIATLSRLAPPAPESAAPTAKPVAPAQIEGHEVVRLYEQMAENESPRFLEALTNEPLTFEELSEKMAANGGANHEVASMRAIYRNVKRREKGLIESGVLSGPVVQSDFTGYDHENAGRYYLEPDALSTLDEYLER
jgi:hypothetical protein